MCQVSDTHWFPQEECNVPTSVRPEARAGDEGQAAAAEFDLAKHKARQSASERVAKCLRKKDARLYLVRVPVRERQFFTRLPTNMMVYKVAYAGTPPKPPPCAAADWVYEEEPDAAALLAYAGNEIRAANAQVFASALEAESESLKVKCQNDVAGKKTREALKKKAAKIRAQEAELQNLAHSGITRIANTYAESALAAPSLNRSRRYAVAFGAQRMSSLARATIYPACVEVDVKKCFFSLSLALVGQLKPERCGVLSADGSLPATSKWVRCPMEVAKMLESGGCADPKRAVLKAAFGGSPEGNLSASACEFLEDIQREGRYLRFCAASLEEDALLFFAENEDVERQSPDATLLSYVLQGMEDYVLELLEQYFGRSNVNSIHFDARSIFQAPGTSVLGAKCRASTFDPLPEKRLNTVGGKRVTRLFNPSPKSDRLLFSTGSV